MSGVRLRLLGAPALEQAGRPLALPTRKLLGFSEAERAQQRRALLRVEGDRFGLD